MTWTDIDSVIRGSLFDLGLPLHYYMRFLHRALNCVKHEIGYDTFLRKKSTRLYVNDVHAIDLPSDYIDWVKVGTEVGAKVRPLLANESYNRLYNYDSEGTPTPYSTTDNTSVGYVDTFSNSHGELLGKAYGYGSSTDRTFKVIEERGQIQLDQSFAEGDKIVLEYIYFDDAATTSLIPPYAEPMLAAYLEWQFKDRSRLFQRLDMQNAKRYYDNEKRKFRARRIGLTKHDIENSLRKGFVQSPKY